MLFWGKKRKTEPSASPSEISSERSLEEDGILSISPVTRPRSKSVSSESVASVDPPRKPVATLSAPRVQPPSRMRKRDFLNPFLQAVRMAVSADTICFVRPLHESDHYYVDDIAGNPTHLQLPEQFPLPAVFREMIGRECAVHQFGLEHLHGETWTYCRPGEVCATLMVAHVPLQPNPGFLLADRKQQSTPFTAYQEQLFADFARLIARVLQEDTAQLRKKPRREIIAEEMYRARQENTPVAFALVYLRAADEWIEQENKTQIEEAEKQLRRALEELSPQARIESFGELVMGVFYYGEADHVSQWIEQVAHQIRKRGELLEQGVYIGAAQLSSVHQTPEDWRSDAQAALHEAYTTGENIFYVVGE